MVNLELVKYIRQLITNGYDVPSIKSHLLQSGYVQADIDSAIDYIYHPPPAGSISLPKKKLMLAVGGGASVLIIIFLLSYFFFFAGPSMLLDLSLDPVAFEVDSGDYFNVIRELTNMGSAKRFDVLMSYTILDPKSNGVIVEQEESFAIETKSSEKVTIPIPSDTRPGRYLLKAVASYGKQKAEASTSFKVVEKVEDSCSDRIKNQGEIGVDCGGPCAVCPASSDPNDDLPVSCQPDCDDFDPCTSNSCNGGVCVFSPLDVCCGDFVCSGDETTLTCAGDCSTSSIPIKTSQEIISDALALVRSDPIKAKTLCSSLSKTDDSDLCHASLAVEINDFNFCDDISDANKRDKCYMDFALSQDKFEVCGKLENRYLKNACFSFKNLRLLQQQRAAS